jgi:alkylhydroperoxidase/carboxymuconolactone decarboxylase family protein YurZ
VGALQLHLFDGFPTTIEALRLVAGLAPGGTPHAVADPDVGAGRQRGVKLFDRVYGHHGLAVRQALEQRAPVLVDWILEHGYGRVLSRPGLAASDREVLAVAILARKGWREQLRAHLRGAVACGADPGLLQEVLQLACTKGELRAESRALVDRLSR